MFLGEDPLGTPNLMPFVAQVAIGRHKHVSVYGNDYGTRDGTGWKKKHFYYEPCNTFLCLGVRDYIHVLDLAEGHVCAMNHILAPERSGVHIFNLGTGRYLKSILWTKNVWILVTSLGTGTTVLELIKAFSKVVGKDIPYVVTERRKGDVECLYASCDKAEKVLIIPKITRVDHGITNINRYSIRSLIHSV